ncbi:MAG: PilZ domain-containing protein [Candidatus Omnitrophica bacterium]|nr:PilZ domain-containing protein [Candidatus Omnitrophota bacterium]
MGYNSTMSTEKRQFYRHPIKVPIQLAKLREETASKTCSEDLSQGGLSFYWPQPLPEGSNLQISIPVEKQLFKMNARVTYCQKDNETGLFKTGVCFEDSASAFRAKLAEEIIEIRQYCEKMSLLRGKKFSEEESARLWVERNAENFSKLMNAA